MKAPIDDTTMRLLVREAAVVRRQRMDMPAREIVQYAREEAERDCFVALMTSIPERNK